MKWQFDKYLILESEQRQKRIALLWVVWVGIFITAIKFVAYAFTHSNAILSDSLESLINLAAGLFTLFSLYYASQPRDSRHPYGHGKIEFLAATVEGILVFAAGTTIIFKAIYNIYHPHAVYSLGAGTLLVAGTTIINLLLARFMLRRSKQHDSPLLKADGKRLLTDAFSSVVLMLGLIIIYFTGWVVIDNILAIMAGLFILHTGYHLVKDSVKWLLDEADNKVVGEVAKLLLNNNNPAWIDIQNVRASHYGMYLYIDCKMIMPRYWELEKTNKEVKKAEYCINQYFKESVELFVQAEPCLPRHCAYCRMPECPVRETPYRIRNAQIVPLKQMDEVQKGFRLDSNIQGAI